MTLANTTPAEDQLIRLIRSEPLTENEEFLLRIIERMDAKIDAEWTRRSELEAQFAAREDNPAT